MNWSRLGAGCQHNCVPNSASHLKGASFRLECAGRTLHCRTSAYTGGSTFTDTVCTLRPQRILWKKEIASLLILPSLFPQLPKKDKINIYIFYFAQVSLKSLYWSVCRIALCMKQLYCIKACKPLLYCLKYISDLECLSNEARNKFSEIKCK